MSRYKIHDIIWNVLSQGVTMETDPFDVQLQRREHTAILQFNTLSINVVSNA